MDDLSVRVVSKRQEAEGICSFELVSVNSDPLPTFTAGAHLDVHVTDHLVRQYSLCNDPAERHRYLIAVLRDPVSRGGSEAMHDNISEGDVLRISPPKNHFGLVPSQHVLLLAGGIGITPILCMAEELNAAGQPFEMHYCARAPERTAFMSRIERSSFADRVNFHFDTGADQQKLDVARLLARPNADAHLYVCGPAGFISHVLDAAKLAGWLDEHVHREFFAAPAATVSEVDAPFEVQVASTQETYTIPANRSIFEVLSEHGVDIPVSCESGVCGTCLTRVLKGIPDHRDVYMSDSEHSKNDQVTVCCSRSKSALLVLDL